MTNHDPWREALDQFLALLQDPDSLEDEWQQLFFNCPFILTECLSLGIHPHELLSAKRGQAEADFYFYPQANDPFSTYGVIELKRPSTSILSQPRKDVICLSHDATTAVAQAKKYALQISARVIHPDTEVTFLGNSLLTFVIAGLSKELARKITTELRRKQLDGLLPPGLRLIPYDTLLKRLTSKVQPRILVLVPSYPEIPVIPDAQEEPIPERVAAEPAPARTGLFGPIFGPRTMHSIRCSGCGQRTEVPFLPTEGRPVYCKACYTTHKPNTF